ncbi:MAG: hypothetical protein QOH61_139, partial [Chloroflexota bacterium]|nr:hypothetical protein [Chloroflexota bacterium]
LSRIERGLSDRVPAETLFRLASVLGMRLSIKAYPDGPPLRDAGQTALIARLRARTCADLRWRYEVLITNDPSDRRAWDAEVTGPDVKIRVEAEVRLHDVQALERRLALKLRDSPSGTVILLIQGSAANRRLLAGAASSLMDAFPNGTRLTLAALAVGRDPGRNTIVLL